MQTLANVAIVSASHILEKLVIEVSAAVIYLNDKILCFQRGIGKFDYTSFKYEFPGGKLEEGESPEDALIRELDEELGISVKIGQKLTSITHDYPDFSIYMHCYICETDEFSGELTEHIAYAQLKPHELDQLDWIEADKPIVTLLMEKADDSTIR